MGGGEVGGEGHAAFAGEQAGAQEGGDGGGGGVAAAGFEGEGEGEGDGGSPLPSAEAERVERETRWAAKERERLARPNVASSLKARFEEGTFEEDEEGAEYAQGHQGGEEHEGDEKDFTFGKSPKGPGVLDQYIPDEFERRAPKSPKGPAAVAADGEAKQTGAAEEQKKASRTGGADWADAHDDMVRLRHTPRRASHTPHATRHAPRATRHAPRATRHAPRATSRHAPRATSRHAPRATSRHATPRTTPHRGP